MADKGQLLDLSNGRLFLQDLKDINSWAGPRLRTKFSLVGQLISSLSSPGVDTAMEMTFDQSVDAAIADGEEFEHQNQHLKAVKCYEYALILLQVDKVIDLDQIVDLLYKQSALMLKMEEFRNAFNKVSLCLQIKPDFLKGYTMKSTVMLKGYGARAFPALFLLSAFEHCQLTTDEQADLIVQASQLLASVAQDRANGRDVSCEVRGIKELETVKSCRLPESKTVWDRVFHRLYSSQEFAAMALLSVGFLDGNISHLNSCARNKDVDCSNMAVEQVYEHLSPLDVKLWGHRLVIFIIEHCSRVCQQTEEPLGVNLVRLALNNRQEEQIKSVTIHQPAPKHHAKTDIVQEQTNSRVDRLKAEGKRALQAKDFQMALDSYKDAVAELKQTGSRNMRDLAILYCNMATVHASMMNAESACSMVRKSIEVDPTYHKPYWRLGKILLDRKAHLEACEEFLRGASCREADTEQKSTFLIEICGTLPFLSEKQAENILDRVQQYLAPCWPKIAENLTKNSRWDAMRRLVLGPPCVLVNKSVLPAGWRYADRYTDEPQQKVGYAMCLKATTHDLSTLVAVVEAQTAQNVCECATDLVLALLLQGAKLDTLATKEDGTSCYLVAVNLCCLTERLGLMRYILSDNATTKKAQLALGDEKRTLLHSVCLHFSDGEHLVGQKLASLLMEKGFDPAAHDILRKKAADYLAPGSAVTKILEGEVSGPSGETAKELGQEGNSMLKKQQYREAIAVYSKAIAIVSAALPSSVAAQTASGHDEETHELSVLFGNRAECYLKLSQMDKALSDAMDSVSWDGHWYKGHMHVGQILMEQRKPERALKAFTNAFNTLEHDPSEKLKVEVLKELLKVEVLKELMKCLVQMAEQSPKRPSNLGFVSSHLWTMVVYEFLCEGIRNNEMHVHIPHLSWKAGQIAVAFLTEMVLSSQLSKSLPRLLQLDLQPLCSWHLPREFTEAFAWLFIALLLQGSDHRRLSFYKGDTYLHATVCFTMLSGEALLLDHVMTSYVRPKKEENIQDVDGNTVLHIVALPVHPYIPELSSECRESTIEILLEMGMDPSIRNKQGKTPLECLSPTDNSKLKEILQGASEKHGTRSQVSGASAQRSSKKKSKSVSQGQSKPSSTVMPVERAQQCSDCQEQLNDVRLALDVKPEVIFKKLTSVLRCSHPKNSANALLVSEAVDLTVKELSKSGSSGVPQVLLTLSTGHFQQVLEKLAAQDKWLQLQAVIDKALCSDISLGHFAKSISLKALVCSQGLLGLEPQRVKILDMLISHGAQLVGNQGRDAMKAALHNGEFLVAERLLKLGTDPRFLTLVPGDSPLLVALEVALKKDTGNFALFQYLVSLFANDRSRFPFLDPHRQYAVLQAQIEKSDDTEAARRAAALILPYQ